MSNNARQAHVATNHVAPQVNIEDHKSSTRWKDRVDLLPVDQQALVKLIFDEIDLRMAGFKTMTLAYLARKSVRSIVDSPFVEHIQETDKPAKLKVPNLSIFRRNSNPQNHLSVYQIAIEVKRVSDVLQCVIFPTTLHDGALKWF